MDEFMTNILETIDMCAKKSLPIPKGNVRIKKNPIACWQQEGSNHLRMMRYFGIRFGFQQEDH